MTGIKYDGEKPQMDLLDFDALEGLAKVLTVGAKKYGRNNWKLGLDNSRLVSALLRHLSAIQRGEDMDVEMGLPHIDCVGANWMFLSSNFKQRPHLDDRLHIAGTNRPSQQSSAGSGKREHYLDDWLNDLEKQYGEDFSTKVKQEWETYSGETPPVQTSQWTWTVNQLKT